MSNFSKSCSNAAHVIQAAATSGASERFCARILYRWRIENTTQILQRRIALTRDRTSRTITLNASLQPHQPPHDTNSQIDLITGVPKSFPFSLQSKYTE
jgi:hypothetical protein